MLLFLRDYLQLFIRMSLLSKQKLGTVDHCLSDNQLSLLRVDEEKYTLFLLEKK